MCLNDMTAVQLAQTNNVGHKVSTCIHVSSRPWKIWTSSALKKKKGEGGAQKYSAE